MQTKKIFKIIIIITLCFSIGFTINKIADNYNKPKSGIVVIDNEAIDSLNDIYNDTIKIAELIKKINSNSIDSIDSISAINLFYKYDQNFQKKADSIINDIEYRTFRNSEEQIKQIHRLLNEPKVSNEAISNYIKNETGIALNVDLIQLWRLSLSKNKE